MTTESIDNVMGKGRPVVVLAAGDWAVVNALTFLLETEGCFVLAFASGEAALARDLKNVACFVVDESLQGEMSASDLVSALRSDGITVPVLFMATHPDGPAKEWAARDSCDDRGKAAARPGAQRCGAGGSGEPPDASGDHAAFVASAAAIRFFTAMKLSGLTEIELMPCATRNSANFG